MKINELLESQTNPVDVIMAGIDAAMVRGSMILNCDAFDDEVGFAIAYDFPEHRTGMIQKVRAVVKSLGKLNAEKAGDMHQPGIDFQLILKTPLTDIETADLKARLKKTYPGTIFE